MNHIWAGFIGTCRIGADSKCLTMRLQTEHNQPLQQCVSKLYKKCTNKLMKGKIKWYSWLHIYITQKLDTRAPNKLQTWLHFGSQAFTVDNTSVNYIWWMNSLHDITIDYCKHCILSCKHALISLCGSRFPIQWWEGWLCSIAAVIHST